MTTRIIFGLLFILLSFYTLAQKVSGVVVDDGGIPLIGVNISFSNNGLVTGLNGEFVIEEAGEEEMVTFSYVGYSDVELSIAELVLDSKVIMMVQDQILATSTITASRYAQRLSESTVSVDVIKPQLIASNNLIEVDDVLDKVSGVQMIGGQANIRGGSGFSYGAGSRVMLLIDDLPALQVDAGFTNWGDIPIENIGQIEVVKGAASSLYGSAALNGIVNVRTADPTTKPETQITIGYGQYGDFKDSTKVWWGDTTRYEYNVSAVHRRRIGKLDLTTSVFHTRQESFNRFTYENRKRATVKLGYYLTDRLLVKLSTMINDGDNGDFFLWANGNAGATSPFLNGVNTQNNFRYYLDPSIRYIDKYDNVHKLMLRRHYIDNQNSGNQSNTSTTNYGEYQYTGQLSDWNTTVTKGVVGSHTRTVAPLLSTNTMDSTFITKIAAWYGQTESKITTKWSLSLGVRYEYNLQNVPDTINAFIVPEGRISGDRWIVRVGSQYSFRPYSSVRASYGQGYRFPTVTERFISTNFGGFQISPNPNLSPETGWTAEIGFKQGLKLAGAKGYIDVAAFTSRYQDMMEFQFLLQNFNFTSINVCDTRINGIEVSLFSGFDIGHVSVQAFGGYTFIDPIYTNFENNEDLQSGLSTDQNILKYRSQHLFKMDVQADYKAFSLGLAYNYSSEIVNIDRVLEYIDVTIPPLDLIGVRAYRQQNKGFRRLDSRFSYKYKWFTATAYVLNVLNRENSLRPALLEIPRTIGGRVDIAF